MTNTTFLGNTQRLAQRFRTMASFGAIASFLILVLSLLWPLEREADGHTKHNNREIQTNPQEIADIQALLRSMAGRRLIRPSQVQAAVKDTGLADRLAKKLKLQGIVQMGGTLVAYIQVEKQGVKGVRQGDQILDFRIEKIESGKVTLSLQGIQIVLQH